MKRGRILLLAVWAVLLAGALPARAQNFPECSGYVMDTARVLDTAKTDQLIRLFGALDLKTSAQVAVVTVPSLEGISVEEYAMKFFQKCGIGRAGKDNGVLLLVSTGDRMMRIEVGYGLEGVLNDAKCGAIRDSEILPRFKQGDMAGGIVAGSVAIVREVAKEYNVTLDELQSVQVPAAAPAAGSGKSTESFFQKLFSFIIIIVLLIAFMKNPSAFLGFVLGMLLSGGRGGGWSSGRSGGFGGGFGGFGGGTSGGGGASGSW